MNSLANLIRVCQAGSKVRNSNALLLPILRSTYLLITYEHCYQHSPFSWILNVEGIDLSVENENRSISNELSIADCHCICRAITLHSRVPVQYNIVTPQGRGSSRTRNTQSQPPHCNRKRAVTFMTVYRLINISRRCEPRRDDRS